MPLAVPTKAFLQSISDTTVVFYPVGEPTHPTHPAHAESLKEIAGSSVTKLNVLQHHMK